MSVEIPPHEPVPEVQEAARSNIALTQNVWVTVLDTTRNVVCRSIMIYQLTANEDLEVEITDDVGIGVVAWSATHSTAYQIRRDETADNENRYNDTSADMSLYSPYLVKSRVFKVRIRKTTATGANITHCKVLYSKW